MKVKVNIYSEKSLGAPLTVLIDPVYGEVSAIAEITPLITTALNAASPYIPNQEIITLVESYKINTYLDIINLQVYLRQLGFVLEVTEVSTEPTNIGTTGVLLEIVSPKLGELPVSTTYFDESGNFDMVDVIDEIVNKFSLGNPNLVPSSDIINTLSSIKDMRSRGMQVFPMYIDTLEQQLLDFGFQMFYVYIQ